MLPRRLRLDKENAARAKREGKVFRNKDFLIRYVREQRKPLSSGAGHTGLAVAVSSRQLKRASARNLLKRRIRQVLSEQAARLQPGWAVIIFPQGRLLGLKKSELENLLLNALEQIKLI